MSGKIYGDSDIYISHRYGKTVISHYPKHRDPSKITPRQHELNSSFAQISKQAKQELADPARRAYWQQRYDEYKSTAKPADNTISPSVALSSGSWQQTIKKQINPHNGA